MELGLCFRCMVAAGFMAEGFRLRGGGVGFLGVRRCKTQDATSARPASVTFQQSYTLSMSNSILYTPLCRFISKCRTLLLKTPHAWGRS